MAKSWIAACVVLFDMSAAVRISQDSVELTQSKAAEDMAAFGGHTNEGVFPFGTPLVSPKVPMFGAPPLLPAWFIPPSRAIPVIRPGSRMAEGPFEDGSPGKMDTQEFELHEEGDASKKGSYDKVIDGVKYQRHLLNWVLDVSKDGQVSYAEARLLWENAEEWLTVFRRLETFMYALTNIEYFKFTSEARAFLKSQVYSTYDGESYYSTIDGVKYNRELLEKAETFAKDGQISHPEANELWEDAKAGNMAADECEKRTFEYMLANLKFTDKAKKFLESHLKPATGANPYYLDINGVKFDRELVEKAESFARDGPISIAQAKELLEDAQDGKRVSRFERRTLAYTMAYFEYTDEAKTFMQTQLEI